MHTTVASNFVVLVYVCYIIWYYISFDQKCNHQPGELAARHESTVFSHIYRYPNANNHNTALAFHALVNVACREGLIRPEIDKSAGEHVDRPYYH